ncbi:ABC transporter ATP-binding protein [Deinococcus lacus]|uniref:ABC transporter ATP-binding protein n=1 Tax=Deinococcus lacus TaxID=392561 RepID=A0ABW1YAN7_9DEIO
MDIPALQAVCISHAFGGTQVLHDVSLRVEPGEVVAVTGPSGSGKSTLLHLLGGLDTPSAGEVWWADVRADQLATEQRARQRARFLGLVFQHHYLLEDLSLLDNVRLPLLLGDAAPQAAAERAAHLLDRVGLMDRAAERPGILSGGERQRVAVARALAAQPRALLADEPTGSLDRANAERVAGLLLELAREERTGVLLVTHDESLSAQADRSLHLLDGHL